ncbi:hypothetical protein EC991_000275 [Linnemannia zychae]|nr:hypothetical protein EC991_000275 [Linnemannia zychae]
MVAVDILTEDTPASSSSSRNNETYSQYKDHYSHSSPQEPLLSSSSYSPTAATCGQRSDHHHRRSSLSSSSSSSSFSSTYSSTTKHNINPPKQSFLTSGVTFLAGCIYSIIACIYNRITAYLFPNEPEPLDLPSTIFFVAQVPFLFIVFLTWIPSFMVWLLGWRVSQAGDRGRGQGMRKTWSLRLALSLSFLKVYLRHADKLTIEECQSRSRSIPFMTAPAGIRINKIKIPAFPFRSRAESIVYEHLTEQERGWLHWNRKDDETKGQGQEQQDEGEGLSVKVQRQMDMELDSIHNGSNHSNQKKMNKKKSSKSSKDNDQFAEGLDAEWLEYVGPAETETDKAEMTSENMAAVLYFHGGGYYTGSKEEHRVLIGPLVRRLGKHVRILIMNYRLAPQHPFPAALVDALSCYMWLLDQSVSETFGFDTPPSTPTRPTDNFQPRQIVFMGDSAGGGLALSLSLLLRDHASPAIPQPIKIVTWSPWLDLTQALPSFKENALTDCIPYEDFTHLHSSAVDGMFRHMETPEDGQCHQRGTKDVVRQRAQVYCPDTCLKMKYVSPLYETDFSGIPEVLIVCGSAERFANECILLASRLEEQQLPCRIDIHEDMPHIFPLFRFHPSSITALDRTSAYVREAVSTSLYAPMDSSNSRNIRSRSDSVVIPISPSSSSSSVSNSPSPSPPPFSRPITELSRDGSSMVLIDDTADGYLQNQQRQQCQDENGDGRMRRERSTSSLSSATSSSTFAAQQQQQQGQHPMFDSQYVSDAAVPASTAATAGDQTLKKIKKKKQAVVNVIDLSGSSVMSFHKQTRFGTPSDRDRALLEMETQEEETGLLNDSSSGLRSRKRRRRREKLTLQDVVSDATLYEWEVLLKQGYIPTRVWPKPLSSDQSSSPRRRRV